MVYLKEKTLLLIASSKVILKYKHLKVVLILGTTKNVMMISQSASMNTPSFLNPLDFTVKFLKSNFSMSHHY